jgi:hypothetical protein
LKLIDFGSACFEGKTMYSYIQSRFYRSPEVLLGVPYNGAIDLWSLGCVCAEMFVGLPIFPGVSQHNQLSRIVDMLGPIPDALIRQGKNGPKFFTLDTTSQHPPTGSRYSLPSTTSNINTTTTTFTSPPSYRLKTPEEYAFENQTTVPTFKKYLKYDHLDDIILRCPTSKKSKTLNTQQKNEEMIKRKYFLDFLKGLFTLNPFERWTAKQALNHPFISEFERIGTGTSMSGEQGIEVTTTTPTISSTQQHALGQPSSSLLTREEQGDVLYSVSIPMMTMSQQRENPPLLAKSSDEILVTVSPPLNQNPLHSSNDPSPLLLPYIPTEDPILLTRYQQFQQKVFGVGSSNTSSVSTVIKEMDNTIGREFRMLKKIDRRESEPIGLNSRRDGKRNSLSETSAVSLAIPLPPPPSVGHSEQLASSVTAASGASLFWPSFGQQPSTSTVLSSHSQTQAQQLSPEKQVVQDQKKRFFSGPSGGVLFQSTQSHDLHVAPPPSVSASGAYLMAQQPQHLQSQQLQSPYQQQPQDVISYPPHTQWSPSYGQQQQASQGGLGHHHPSNRTQQQYAPPSYQANHIPSSSHRIESGGIPIPSAYNQNPSQMSRNMASSYHSHASSYNSLHPSSLGGLGGMGGNMTGDFGLALNRADLDESRYLQSYAHQQSPQSYSPLSYSPGSLGGMSNMSPLRVGSYSNQTGLSPLQREGKNPSSKYSSHGGGGPLSSYDPQHHLSTSLGASPGGNSMIPGIGIASLGRGYELSPPHRHIEPHHYPSSAYPESQLPYPHGSSSGPHSHGFPSHYQQQPHHHSASSRPSSLGRGQHDHPMNYSLANHGTTDHESHLSNYPSSHPHQQTQHPPHPHQQQQQQHPPMVSALTAALVQASLVPPPSSIHTLSQHPPSSGLYPSHHSQLHPPPHPPSSSSHFYQHSDRPNNGN